MTEPRETSSAAIVAALYVETDGVYFNLPGVDPWDEKLDARLYPGPYPVVAHPPCKAWCALAGMRETRYGYKVGDDGGCFEAALEAVRTYGGILEHPAHSRAWKRFGLPVPIPGCWSGSLTDPGFSARVDQGWYGHQLRKPTWLYSVGVDVRKLEWGVGPGRRLAHRDPGLSAAERERMTIPTPIPFRDLLLELARTVTTAPPVVLVKQPTGEVSYG